MELLVQKYLRSGKTLEELREDHGIKSHITNDKVCLNYHQLESKEGDALAQQCRGLVLRLNSWDVVACPMFRFFNLEQKGLASEVDWSSACYEEKMDGTMVYVYYDQNINRWLCGTRSRCEADANAHDAGMTFSKLLNITVDNIAKSEAKKHSVAPLTIHEMMLGFNTDLTFIFELTTPLNRIVCKYEDFGLTLIAVRNNVTFDELNPKLFSWDLFDVQHTKTYDFNNVNHMIQVVHKWKAEEHEGVVVKDRNFNRVKVKNPQYITYNHLRDSLSTSIKGCVEAILNGTDDDLSAMMPNSIVNRISAFKPVILKLIKEVDNDFNKLKDINEKKEFALAARECIWDAPLFAYKNEKAKDFFEFIKSNNKDGKISENAIKKIIQLCYQIEPKLKEIT